MQYLIGVDLGTSGVKTVLFDETGAALASLRQQFCFGAREKTQKSLNKFLTKPYFPCMLYLFSPAVRPHKPPEKSIF